MCGAHKCKRSCKVVQLRISQIASRCLSVVPRQHFQQFNLEDQVRIRRDVRADLPFSVSEVGRYEQLALASDFHAHQALIPAFNYAPGAEHALEGFTALVGGVEHGAVFQGAGIWGGDQGAFDAFLAVAQLKVYHLQFVVHLVLDRFGCLRWAAFSQESWDVASVVPQSWALVGTAKLLARCLLACLPLAGPRRARVVKNYTEYVPGTVNR